MTLTYESEYQCVDAIAHNARVHARRTAVVCGEARQTWCQLDRSTSRVANALLALGLQKGDKVALFMPNSMDLFELFWGTIRAGCVVVSLNTMLEGSALTRLTNASDAKILFVDDGTRPLVDSIRPTLTNIPPDRFFTFGSAHAAWRDGRSLFDGADSTAPRVRIDPEDSMSIIFSSGTTGVPKGIEHSHRGRMNYPLGFGMGLRIDRYSVAICATPIYASGTWITMLPTMYRGGTVVLLPQFSPRAFLDAVQRERGTHSFLVPTQYIGILQQPLASWDTRSLRALVTAGQSLPTVVYDALLENFPGVGLYEVYGMTEGFATLAIPEDVTRGKRGSVGKAAFLDDIRVIDEAGREAAVGETGEIVAYGMGMMKGYYNRPDLTEAVTWVAPGGRTFMRTGDLGHVDEDGFLFVSGRLKDMIKSGGINIYAADLEEVVMQYPGVSEAAVIGVPHDKWGEAPVAVVIAKPGATVDSEQLMAWVNERLSKYQRLTEVLVETTMPRATYGKVQKQQLREQVLERGGRRSSPG